MDFDLASSTIGAIREFIDSQTSRGGLKGLALRAGAKTDRVLKIKISGNMRDADYKSKSELMGAIIDTLYEDFEKPAADGILLRMVASLIDARETLMPAEQLQTLEQGLAESHLSVAQVTGFTGTVALMETTAEQTHTSDMREATDLLMKGLLRLSTDKPGAITACTSACESACELPLNGWACRFRRANSCPITLRRFVIRPTSSLWPASAARIQERFLALCGVSHNTVTRLRTNSVTATRRVIAHLSPLPLVRILPLFPVLR